MAEENARNRRPNFLLITSDQQHWFTLGVQNPKIKTPNLDRLCREGMRFDRAYTNSPVCTPSRATIITGQYPSWHGAWSIGVHLPEDVPTVGDVFQENGYSSSLIGKAHFQPQKNTPGHPSIETGEKVKDLDFWRSFYGPWYGFEYVETLRNHGDGWLNGSHYAVWLEDEKGIKDWGKWCDSPQDSGQKGKKGWYWQGPHRRRHSYEIPQELYYGTWLAERTMARLEHCQRDGRPFFMWASFPDPHPPYLIPEPWASMYDPADMELDDFDPKEFEKMPPHYAMTQDPEADWSGYHENGINTHGLHDHTNDPEEMKKDMAVYYGMISMMDDHIGMILAKLDELGMASDTAVVFSTDHGHYLGHHGLLAKGPFGYEDGIRVPFIVRYPGVVPAGKTSRALQALIDLPETFLDFAGIEIPGQMQGVSQRKVWTGEEESATDHVIVEHRHQPTVLQQRMFITERYKLVMYRDQDYGELFDFESDPEERDNKWGDPGYAAVKCELMRKWLHAEMGREPTRMPRVSGA